MDWDFLQDMLLALNIPFHFVSIVMTCITSTQYSLLVNSSPSDVFHPKKGLRQGDPLSPLLFVIGMEYLSRLLIRLGEDASFKFHPRCRKLRLNHLCFADDLMLFCKDYHVKEMFASDVCLPLGNLPFRYLGIPLTAKKISAADCDILVDKMTAIIRLWYSKNLSYAGRLQLVSSILMSISSYWCQLFILPKAVINKVNSICRSFLWFADHRNPNPGNINWNQLCKLKKEGGLGLRHLETWNIVAVGKLVWHVSSLQESLWVRWVHRVYSKGASWRLFNPPITSSWSFKKICKVKDKLHPWVYNSSYRIGDVYKLVLGTGPVVRWDAFVWNRLSVPKARFIAWLAISKKLKTKDRLVQMGVLTENICPLCGLCPESVEHLFFDCCFSKQCIFKLQSWLGLQLRTSSLHVMATKRWRIEKIRRKILFTSLCSLSYHVWKRRNDVV